MQGLYSWLTTLQGRLPPHAGLPAFSSFAAVQVYPISPIVPVNLSHLRYLAPAFKLFSTEMPLWIGESFGRLLHSVTPLAFLSFFNVSEESLAY